MDLEENKGSSRRKDGDEAAENRHSWVGMAGAWTSFIDNSKPKKTYQGGRKCDQIFNFANHCYLQKLKEKNI